MNKKLDKLYLIAQEITEDHFCGCDVRNEEYYQVRDNMHNAIYKALTDAYQQNT